MKGKIFMLIILGIALMVSGCEDQTLSPELPQGRLEAAGLAGATESSITRKNDSEAAPAPCLIFPEFPDWPSNFFLIEQAAIRGDILILTLSYSGGCEPHVFNLIALPFQESQPVKVFAEVFHNGNNDPCDLWVTEIREFDLSPLKVLYQDSYGTSCGKININFRNAEPQPLSVTYRFCDER